MPLPEAFCSIATPAHLGKTMACLKSLYQQQPTCRIVLLLLEGSERDRVWLSELGWLRVLAPEDGPFGAVYSEMRARYSLAEQCFALKPYLIKQLLDEGFPQAHYIDGDCLIYRPLTPLVECLGAADLLLTPHVLAPVPEDGRKPGALTLLRGGTFNGGYIGVRNTGAGHSFIGWLGAMTRERAHNQPKLGMCGDQRWLDLAPALIPGTAICRLRGANAAYWNLHERPLSCGPGGTFAVGDEPLLFFHFSGFSATRPPQLSRFQDRHIVEPGSALATLINGYELCVAAETRSHQAAVAHPRGSLLRWPRGRG